MDEDFVLMVYDSDGQPRYCFAGVDEAAETMAVHPDVLWHALEYHDGWMRCDIGRVHLIPVACEEGGEIN